MTFRSRVSLIDRSGAVSQTSTNAVGKLDTDIGNTIYGPTFPYPFTLDFPSTTGLSGIAVGDEKFPLQDSLFVIPTLSSIEPGLAEYNITDPTHLFTFNITAAVSNHSPHTNHSPENPQPLQPITYQYSPIYLPIQLLTSHPPPTLKVTFAIPVPQPGTISPRIDYSTKAELKQIGEAGPFAIFSAIVEQNLTSLQVFGASVDIEDESSGTKALFFKLFYLMLFF